MWMLVALMGAVAASGAVNLDWGRPADEEDAEGQAEAAEGEAQGEGDLLEIAARDSWLDGWTDDDQDSGDQDSGDQISRDTAEAGAPPVKVLPENRLAGMPVVTLPNQNEDGAERDPWLEGWREDEWLSTDEVPALPALAHPGGGTVGLGFGADRV